jgi:hypothetical protein
MQVRHLLQNFSSRNQCHHELLTVYANIDVMCARHETVVFKMKRSRTRCTRNKGAMSEFP